MKIAKEFHWEMGHRLPDHFGKCKNIHGHSYKMIVEIEGDVEPSGMVMDYYDLKKVVKPIVEELDHAFMVFEEDKETIEFLTKMNSKKIIVDFQSTVENICRYFLNRLKSADFPSNVNKLTVRIYETHDDYAEEGITINEFKEAKKLTFEQIEINKGFLKGNTSLLASLEEEKKEERGL